MSRGHGRWERAIVQAASTAVVVPVSGVVHATVVTPARADFTSARRAARTLATKSQVSALYTWTCPGCFAVQDRPDPVKCCERVRPMLSVTRPERRHLVRHPASPPGGSVPRWLSAAPVPPAGLVTPTAGDVAALAMRRLWERLESGAAVSVQDVAGLLRLQRELERDAAAPDAGTSERWHATLRELLWLFRHHLGDKWPAFAADVRASEVLRSMWGDPPPRGPGP